METDRNNPFCIIFNFICGIKAIKSSTLCHDYVSEAFWRNVNIHLLPIKSAAGAERLEWESTIHDSIYWKLYSGSQKH